MEISNVKFYTEIFIHLLSYFLRCMKVRTFIFWEINSQEFLLPPIPICNLIFKDFDHCDTWTLVPNIVTCMNRKRRISIGIFLHQQVFLYIMWVSLSLSRCRSTWVTKLMLIFCCSVLNSRLKQNHASCDHFYCLHLATFYLWRIFTNTFLGHQQPNVSIYKLNSTLYTLWGVEFLY